VSVLAVLGKTISIDKYLKKRLLFQALEGLLTSCEDTDTEDHNDGYKPRLLQEAGDARSKPRAAPPVITGPSYIAHKEKQQKRNVDRKGLKRSQNGTGRKRVASKRGTEAKLDGLVLASNMASGGGVSRSGWIRRPQRDLPKQVFTKDMLERGHGVRRLNWDGTCVCFWHLVRFLLRMWILGPPTYCWISSTESLAHLSANRVILMGGGQCETMHRLCWNMGLS
jgi:hypothetical protein